jgi:hypothetical protein
VLRQRLNYPDLKRATNNLYQGLPAPYCRDRGQGFGDSVIKGMKSEGYYCIKPYQELEKELFSFPNSKFDDQVDSVAQTLDYMRKNHGYDIWAALGRL